VASDFLEISYFDCEMPATVKLSKPDLGVNLFCTNFIGVQVTKDTITSTQPTFLP